jgi:hypothetical protein
VGVHCVVGTVLARGAVTEERARIARELHDFVAHNASVMVIQAGAERHALPDDQTATCDAFAPGEQAGVRSWSRRDDPALRARGAWAAAPAA